MAHYVISDFHGEENRFHAMLENIWIPADDILYILGDAIDRGPDEITLLQEVMNTPNLILILGNYWHI